MAQAQAEAEQNAYGREETVGLPVALEYLLEGGKGSIENAGYFLYGVQAAFPHIAAELQRVRDSIPSELLGMTPDLFVASNPHQLQEMRNFVAQSYGDKGVELFDKLTTNSTGFIPREGKKVGLELENLTPVEAPLVEAAEEVDDTPSLLDVVRTLYSKGKDVASKLFQRSFFDVAQTPKFMQELGLRGDKFTIKYGVIARHLGKDSSHTLTERDWEQLPQALQNPFAISKLTDKTDSYRIYTTLQTESGEFVVVGADVKNAGREIEVNAVSTVFGRRNNANLPKNEEVIYRSKEITPEQSSLLERPNFAQYPTEQELSNSKDTTSSQNNNEIEDKNVQPTIGEQIQAAEAEVNINPTEAQKEVSFSIREGNVASNTIATEVAVGMLKDAGVEVVEATDAMAEAVLAKGGVMMSMDSAPFYSNAKKAVLDIKQDKATPQQWVAMLKKNGGLKAGEDAWLGLESWLSGQTGSVTKQEIIDYIDEHAIEIEEVNYGESEVSQFEDSDIYNEWAELGGDEDAFNEMIERYGDDFEMAFLYDEGQLYVADEDAASFFIDKGTETINETRLSYTTEGLTDNREIALTVPTIEPYNQNDDIHFGDAGGGRAVAWVRFGETTAYEEIDVEQEVTEFNEPYKASNGHMVYKPKGKPHSKDFIVYGQAKSGKMIYVVYINEKQIPVAHATFEEARDAMNVYYKEHPQKRNKPLKVLVIDEIQSKRHQDGREKGYREREEEINERVKAARGANIIATNAHLEFRMKMKEKYGNPMEFQGSAEERKEARKAWKMRWTAEELATDTELYDKMTDTRREYEKLLEKQRGVPVAPFEKNWHELAMKRMLRYAAENGYDKVAWTTGAQQAARYDMRQQVDNIQVEENNIEEFNDGTPIAKNITINTPRGNKIRYQADAEGNIRGGEYGGKNLKDVVGKELAEKIMQPGSFTIEEEGLAIGGEGMKGFYDKMLPSFVNKYTKKWGAKVGEVTMPSLEDGYQTMHSVDVTPQMKEDVMKGQPMFLRTPNGTVYGWTQGGKVFLTKEGMNAETPIHEYTHLWDKMVQQKNPELWNRGKELLKQTPTWNEVVNDKNYANIAHDEDAVASEVHSRLSGENGAKVLEQMIKDARKDGAMAVAKAASITERIKEWIKDMFAALKETLSAWSKQDLADLSIEDFNNLTLRDLAEGVNPNEYVTEEGDVQFMGSRVDKRMADISNYFNGRTLSAEQQAVVDVYSGKSNNLPISINRADSNIKVVMRQGVEQKAGAKHSLFRHYGTNVGVITSEDIILIPEIFANGERVKKQHGNTTLYEYKQTINGVKYTVLTEVNNRGAEIFDDYYTDRSKVARSSNTQLSAQADSNLASQREVTQNSANSNSEGEITRQGSGVISDEGVTMASDPVSKAIGEPRYGRGKKMREYAERQRRLMAQKVQEIAQKLKLDNVEIVTDASTLSGKRAKAKGYFNPTTGKIVIVIPNHASVLDVEETVLHEAVAHYGLRKLFGKHFDTFLDNVYESADPEIRKKIASLAAKNGWDFRKATEEYLAMLAEDTEFESVTYTGWWFKVKELFRKMLDKLGLEDFAKEGLTLSDNELRYILLRSYQHLQGHRGLMFEAEDAVKQYELGVGNYSAPKVAESGEEGDYYRDGDFTPRDRVMARDHYERVVSSGSYQFREAVQDSMLGLRRLMESILPKTKIEEIAGSENAYIFENRMSSTNAGEQHVYFTRYMKPLLEEIGRICRASKVKRDALTEYLMAKHGLERNEYMRKKDIEAKLNGIELTNFQKVVAEAYTTNANNLTIGFKDAKGKSRNIRFRQGDENKAGIKHSVFKHYQTNSNYFSADEVLLIPQILEKGKRKQSGKDVTYELSINDAIFTVTTEMSGMAEKFTNFFTNRKPTVEEQGSSNTENQHEQPQQSVSQCEVTQNSANSNSEGEITRQGSGVISDEGVTMASDPVSKAIGEPRYGRGKKMREYAERQRRLMAQKVQEIAQKLKLDNVEIVTDASTLSRAVILNTQH